MATVIRLKRGGRKHAPYYRVVVVDGRTRALGRELEQIGIYQPCARPEPRIQIDAQKAYDWLRKGAQPSNTVRNVLSKFGVMEAFAKGRRPEQTAATAVAEPAAPETAPAGETAEAENAAETGEAAKPAEDEGSSEGTD